MAWSPGRCTPAALAMVLSCLLVMQQTTADPEPLSFLVKYADGNENQAMAQLNSQGFKVRRQHRQFRWFVVESNTLAAASTSSNSNADGPSASASAITASAIQAQAIQLQSLPGIEQVEVNIPMRIIKPIDRLRATGATDGLPSTSAPEQDLSSGSAETLATCPLVPEDDPDLDTGRTSEGAPYGIKMVQADTPAAQRLSEEYGQKVLYCVIDTGVDIQNQEFSPETTSGCLPGFPNNDTSEQFRTCYTWYKPFDEHGTHVSGSIAALKNGKGVVGVSAVNPLLYHYKIFNADTFSSDVQVYAWQDCIAELDRQKAARQAPDMKLVISMSYGSFETDDPLPDNYEESFLEDALNQITSQRSDVMFFAAAGNGGPDTMSSPAIYDKVISVAAVDALQRIAVFSSTNKYVDIAAPGVNTLSTVPLSYTTNNPYYLAGYTNLVTTDPVIPAVSANPNLLVRPLRDVPAGADTKDVTAPLVFCGFANATCDGAKGKICLIERGVTSFCDKVKNCAAGGGIGAIIYNSDANPACAPLYATLIIDDGSCTCARRNTGLCITTITLARAQGLALKDALTSAPAFTVSLKFPKIPPQKDIGLGTLSGTSMACPTAAGVAGLVWSAHTECTAAEIRSALLNTALMPAAASNSSGSGASGAKRNNEYGHGIIQTIAAHRYLQENPCKGGRIMLGAITRDGTATAKQPVGAVMSFSIKLSDYKTGQAIAGKKCLVTPRPSRKYFNCTEKYVTTDNNGAARTQCKLLKAGRVSLIITAAKGLGYDKAQFTTNFTITA